MRFQLFVPVPPQLLFLVSSILCASVIAADDWTRDEALAEFRRLVPGARSQGSKETLAERKTKVTAWLERVKTTELDLGKDAFLDGIAYFVSGDPQAASTALLNYAREYKEIPKSDYDSYVGVILLAVTGKAVTSGDFDTVKLTLPIALDHSVDHKVVYQRIGSSLRNTSAPRASAALNDLLRRALTDATLSETERQAVVARIYGRRMPTTKKPETFTATDLDGKKVAIEDYRGKVLLIDFWATWCAPCMVELPNVIATYKKYHEYGFDVLGVSLDKNEAKLRTVLKRLKTPWRQIFQDAKALQKQYRVSRIPFTFLLDRNGVLRYTKLRGRDLDTRVRELLEEAGMLPADFGEKAAGKSSG